MSFTMFLPTEFSECRDELENMRKEMNEYLRMKDTVTKGVSHGF